MSNLEILLLVMVFILGAMTLVIGSKLSDIFDKLQDINRSIYSLKEEDDE